MSVVGAAFVLAGLAMFVLPGPGILVLGLGFAILATEYVWAATALERMKKVAERGGQIAKGTLRKVTRRKPRDPDNLVR